MLSAVVIIAFVPSPFQFGAVKYVLGKCRSYIKGYSTQHMANLNDEREWTRCINMESI